MDFVGGAGLLLAVVAILATFIIYRWQRQRKSLGLAVVTNRPLLAFRSPFAVSVHHDGQVVDNPRLAVVRVANTGNLPIEDTDIDREVTMTFEGCSVLSAEVSGVRPADLAPVLLVSGSTVLIEPCLLNPGDIVEVQALLNGVTDTLRVDCRIVGVTSIQQVALPRDSWGRVWRVSVRDLSVSVIGSLVLMGTGIWSAVQNWGSGGVAFVAFTSVLSGVWFWYGVSTFRKSRIWLALPPPSGH